METQLDNALILLINDNGVNLELMDVVFRREGAKTLRAASGFEALRHTGKYKSDIDLIVTGMHMQDMDYATLVAKMREIMGRRVPILLLADGRKTDEKLLAGLAAGGNDYLSTPINEMELKIRSMAMLHLKRGADEYLALQKSLEMKVMERTIEIQQTHDVTMFGLVKLAEYRDPETGGHLERIREYTSAIAGQLWKNGPYRNKIDNAFIATIHRAAPLHDIGKVGIPDSILLKPGKLTPGEFEIMKRHAAIGGNTLEESEKRLTADNSFLHMAKEIAYWHHEKWDGSGYPSGLKGNGIPLAARIMALADVYDALVSKRVYKSAMSPENAHHIILEGAGKHFDPAVVEAYQAVERDFINIMNRFNSD